MESGKFDFSPSSLKFGSYDLRVIGTFFPLAGLFGSGANSDLR